MQFDKSNGHSFPIPTADFPFDDLDSDEDKLREAIQRNQPLGPIVVALCDDQLFEARREGALTALELVHGHRNPAMFIEAALFACGSSSVLGQTGTSIAKKFGRTKQNFQQLVGRIQKQLGLAQTRTMRSRQAKANMSARNSRR